MSAQPVDVLAIRFGGIDRVSQSNASLTAYGLDEDGDEALNLQVLCAMDDPDEELATIRAVVELCNARGEIIKALRAAEKLLDSVAFVTTEGDTNRPLLLIRAALARCGGTP